MSSNHLPMPAPFAACPTGVRARSHSPIPNRLQVHGGQWRSLSNTTSTHFMRTRSPSVCSKNGKPLAMAPLAKFEDITDTQDPIAGIGNNRSRSPAPKPVTKAVFAQASPSTDVGPSNTVSRERSSDDLPESHSLSRTWALWEKTVSPDEPSTADESEPLEEPQSPTCPYSACMNRVKEFDTIESFMPLFNGIPPPSTIVNKNHIYRQIKMPFEVTTEEEDSSDEEFECPDSPKSFTSYKSMGSILGRKPLPCGTQRQMKQLDAVMFFEEGISPTWEDPVHKNGGILEFTFKTDFPGGTVDDIWEKVLFAVLGNSLPNCDFITGVKMADRLPQRMYMTNPIVGVRFEIWHREMSHEMATKLREDLVDIITGPTDFGGHVVARRFVQKGTFATKTPIIYVQRAPVSNEREVRERPRRGSV